ncbi:MAG: tetratricopeptide repeat protein [Bacteroidales bacterium]|nr:tetratricopeptide repeat protein [Bacteroidales bacterium]
MKRFYFTAVLLLLFCNVAFSQVNQIGVVLELNSNSSPVSGVSITLPTTTDVQPCMSDINGLYTFRFSEKHAGDMIYNIRVVKDGFEVVNARDLKNGWTLTEKDTLKIILAPKGTVAEARLKYYDLIDQYQINSYKNNISILKSQLDNQSITIEEYGKHIANAEKALQQAYSRIDEYADMFARINKDDMDSISAKALYLLENDGVEAAVKLYDDQQLLMKLKDKTTLRNESAEAVTLLVPQLKKEAEFRQIAAGKDNIRTAEEILKQICLAENNYDNAFEYMSFLILHQQYDEAVAVANAALPVATSPLQLTSLYQNLGHTYYKLKNYPEAEKYLLKAIETAEKYSGNEEPYLLELSYCLNTLGNVYQDDNELDKAESTYIKTAEIRQNLVTSDTVYNSEYASVLNNLGTLYITLLDKDKAIENLTKAISLREQLAKDDPHKYEYLLANSFMNLGKLYHDYREFENAEKCYLDAESILSRLATVNPLLYNDYLVILYGNIGSLYSQRKMFDKSEEFHNKSLKICAEMMEYNPEAYKFYSANTLNNLGSMLRKNGEYERALDCSARALEYALQLTSDHDYYIAIYYANYARAFEKLERYDEAIENITKALGYSQTLADNSTRAYSALNAQIHNIAANIYAAAGNKREAKKYYQKTLKMYKELNKDSDRYSKQIAGTKQSLKEL